ncbi:MAG: LPS-assembly protein LptD, partial [Bacteroidaceae bacterium]|nr:LPS-assembly protein LptD [Bacteroidaceae bacterium]
GERKISLIDELSGTLSYNMAAKQRPWSDLNMRVRLKLTKNYTFSLAALFATYAYAFNDRGQVVLSDRTEWSYGRFGRFQGMAQNISYTFNNQSWQKLCNLFSGKRGRENTENGDAYADNAEVDADEANLDPDIKASQRQKKQKVKAKVDADGYMAFSIPWSLSLSYGISMFEDRSKDINVRRMRYPYSFSQSLNASGFIRIADGWNINFTSGYDFEMKRISMTTASLSRDLHCFEMSCSVVLRPYTSFNFSFRARSGELADVLKWDKRSSYSTNIDWY